MLNKEVLNAARLIREGLRQLLRIDEGNDFYHLPLLLLSSGVERLLKSVICLQHLKRNGRFPRLTKELKVHDLAKLLKSIRADIEVAGYVRVPAGAADRVFLDDKRLTKIVRILSDFGVSSRYYNLNVVFGVNNATESPENE